MKQYGDLLTIAIEEAAPRMAASLDEFLGRGRARGTIATNVAAERTLPKNR